LFLATVIPASAMYSSGGPVINLDPSSFKKQLSGDGLWLVEFYAPWCEPLAPSGVISSYRLPH
jgi:hypothetical protein